MQQLHKSIYVMTLQGLNMPQKQQLLQKLQCSTLTVYEHDEKLRTQNSPFKLNYRQIFMRTKQIIHWQFGIKMLSGCTIGGFSRRAQLRK
jgi:hypothetical protein